MKKYLICALVGAAFLALVFHNSIKILDEKIMAITQSTEALISDFEGKSNRAYKDSKGLWTIGVGHLIKSNEMHLLNMILTDSQIADLFKSDLRWCDEAVNSSVRVPLTQNQYDALYSLCFNIGEDHFKASEVVQHLNQKDYQAAGDAFLNWSKPPVLRKRRQREREVFLQDI